MTGYTIPRKGLDVFIKSEQKRVTDTFLNKIAEKVFKLTPTPAIRREIRYYLMPAEAEIRNGWLNIKGNGFSGYGQSLAEYETKGIEPVYEL